MDCIKYGANIHVLERMSPSDFTEMINLSSTIIKVDICGLVNSHEMWCRHSKFKISVAES